MYKLNNISLSDFKIQPSQIQGSNIALAGWLDMPKRLDKTYHLWEDEQGVEPYVEQHDMHFEGRDILFEGFLKYDTSEELDRLLNSFYSFIKSFESLVELETPYGIFEVFIQKEIKTRLVQNSLCIIEISFREPKVVVPFNYFAPGYFSSSYFSFSSNTIAYDYGDVNYSLFGIDGIPFKELGAVMKKPDKIFNRANTQSENKLTAYENETYQITQAGAEKIKVDLVFTAKNIAALKHNIQAFHVILGRHDLRTLQIDNRLIQGFCVGGYKVKNIRQANTQSTAELSTEFIKITNRYFMPGFFAEGYFQ